MVNCNKNTLSISKSEQESLRQKRVCVVGCGGLGGYIIEMLTRAGIGQITIVDDDVFCENNLNRQLFSMESNLSMAKVSTIQNQMKHIHPNTVINPMKKLLNNETAIEILWGHHVVVDAVDNIPTRLVLADHCHKLSIPLVHGAIGGWYGQVTTILPKDNTIRLIYQEQWKEGADIEAEGGSLSFVAATTAFIQCGEVIKLLIGRGAVLSKRLLLIDLLENDFTTIEMG